MVNQEGFPLQRDPKYLVRRIINGMERIEVYTRGKTREEFLESSKIQDAVAQRIKVIGDAAKEIPSEFKQKNAEVPWYRISETVDQLAYDALGIKPMETWEFIKYELPAFKEKIERIYKK